jgi:hypothetical protein
VRTCIDRKRPTLSRRPAEHRTCQRSGHSKKWRVRGSCLPSRLRGWTVRKRPLLKRKMNKSPAKLAHAGNRNQFDGRVRTRIRRPRVGVPSRPLATKAASAVLIAQLATLGQGGRRSGKERERFLARRDNFRLSSAAVATSREGRRSRIGRSTKPIPTKLEHKNSNS